MYRKRLPLIEDEIDCSNKSIEEIIAIPYNTSQKLHMVCESCKKVYVIRYKQLKHYEKSLCRKCKFRDTVIKTFGTYDNYKAQKLSKQKNTSKERYGKEYYFNSAKIKETMMKRYGVANGHNEDTLKKIRETCKKRYNDETYNNMELNKETKKKKYGDENYTNKEKAKETSLKKYGVDNPAKSDLVKYKEKQIFLKKYGYTSPLLDENIKKRSKETLLLHYGVDSPSKSSIIKEKVKATNIKRYGENYAKELILRANKHRLEKYGVEWPLQRPEIAKKAFSHRGMSSPEKKLDEFLSNRHFSYEYQYSSNGKMFDFAVFKDAEKKILSCLIEIDGLYFHGLLSDSDNKHVRGETDNSRFEKVPDGIKFIVCDENKVEECFKEICKVIDIDYDTWIESVISSLPTEFPYPEYSDKRMKNDFLHLCTYSSINRKQYISYSIVRNFHKSIFTSHVGENPSPVEAWSNKSLLEKCVRNRFIYSSSLSSQKIADGFNICKIAPKVSVFNPCLAKELIEKYLNDYSSIFDPFSGFSGRMLGTCSLGKKYIGQDINKTHVDESNEIIKFLNLDASVSQKDLFESSGEYECLFTCPPYNLKETWNNESQANLSCDEWIDECLKRFKCKKYMFVVDKTEKYKDKVVEEITNKSYFNSSSEEVIII
jgi:hypothetical protein